GGTALVALGAAANALDLVRPKLADQPGRNAEKERSGWDARVLRDQRAGTDDRVSPHHRAVQHRRVHADEDSVLDGAAVDDRMVADRDGVPDGAGQPRVGM